MLLLSVCVSLGHKGPTPILFVNLYPPDHQFALSGSYSLSLLAGPPWLKMCYWFGHFLRQWQNCFICFSISWLSLACTIWSSLLRESYEERIRNEKPKCAREQKGGREKGVDAVPEAWPRSQASSPTSTYSFQRLQRTEHPTPATWAWAALLDYCLSPE